jgi:hypothetical protein
MAKYDRLFTLLCGQPEDQLDLTFNEIEAVVGPS